ncbi:hypothetical protein M2360_000909 [Rhizobium sp. SG_E_25_P2]|uniref:hypothetical protein n=1 Tax=Rhizobium sp. SG_E_25_P2 TaxID=2879942 RepID=UPI0024757498|nr:hypothetical protein [Rhizobium sp. SG_E_25_P2]MDH6265519.1 hypothetical protein [Rhizobium sp. SG_E_25_P2]
MSSLALERARAKNRKIPDDEVIYAAIKAGHDHFEIAAAHGGEPGLIRMHIKRKGWDKGAPLELGMRVWPSDAQFSAWIDEGLSHFDMAGATGFHCDTIRQRLKMRGLWEAYQAKQSAIKAIARPSRSQRRPENDGRRVVLDGITRPDGTRIAATVSLPRVSMIAGWKGKPDWRDGEGAGV